MKPEEVLIESTGVIGQRIKKVLNITIHSVFYVAVFEKCSRQLSLPNNN